MSICTYYNKSVKIYQVSWKGKRKSFSVSRYGEAEAKRLAEAAEVAMMGTDGYLCPSGGAARAESPLKRFKLTPCAYLHWETRTPGIAYPYLRLAFTTTRSKLMSRSLSLVKHGVVNAAEIAIDVLTENGYKPCSVDNLVTALELALNVSCTEHDFDLGRIPDII